ncbi:hypothetical protein SLEP1_g53102 [Rubroshorea leprosula]|uniref:Uncharacterized protein n=1 Tax=Rubroshorea leprosula TaxID=152421 RepID=A0AAV5M8C4_9ROSI|nr:hypothetical protein SLEP1_g53102 [Rubroshorea leprosula]
MSSVDERQSFMEKLDEVQEWLYTDGEEATATEFQERLNSLTDIGDPIVFWLFKAGRNINLGFQKKELMSSWAIKTSSKLD